MGRISGRRLTHKPLPRSEAARLYPENPVREQARRDRARVANHPHDGHQDGLLLVGEEHGQDEQKRGNDACLRHPEEESNDKQTGKVVAGNVKKSDTAPIRGI